MIISRFQSVGKRIVALYTYMQTHHHILYTNIYILFVIKVLLLS